MRLLLTSHEEIVRLFVIGGYPVKSKRGNLVTQNKDVVLGNSGNSNIVTEIAKELTGSTKPIQSLYYVLIIHSHVRDGDINRELCSNLEKQESLSIVV